MNAACTIVSMNFLGQAKTLAESYLNNHIDNKFFILLVDKKDKYLDQLDDKYNYIWVEDLGIKNLYQMAFKYNVVEFNTSVKPFFLNFLFRKFLEIENLLYIDPDIYVFKELNYVYDKLQQYDIFLTPHITKIMKDDGLFPDDSLYLKYGTYNLGFLGLHRCEDAFSLLTWWSEKLSSLCFDDTRNNFFVDQVWINLVPSIFNNVYISKHLGCNMAYWNLHERRLSIKNDQYMVNDKYELIFFHFSSVEIDNENSITSKQERFDLLNRPDLKELYVFYKKKLISNDYKKFIELSYSFDYFDTGQKVASLLRKTFAYAQETFNDQIPFSSNSNIYKFASKNKMFGKDDLESKFNKRNYNKHDFRIRAINKFLYILFKLLGLNKFTALMKYLSYISISRHLPEIIIKNKYD